MSLVGAGLVGERNEVVLQLAVTRHGLVERDESASRVAVVESGSDLFENR